MLESSCADGRHTVLVRPYLLGQFRIQVTDTQRPDPAAPHGHGQIVREMCTYSRATMERVTSELAASCDPLAIAESFAKPWNCESPGGRIRLDNAPQDRAEARNA